MNKRLVLLRIVLVMSIVLFVYWCIKPINMMNLNPSEIGEISIFDGNTGTAVHITKEKDIGHIITNLNSIVLKRGKVSLFRMGYSLRTTIYLKNGAEVKGWHTFIINDSSLIRKDPFFYKVMEGKIDYEYIQNIVDAAQ